MSAIETDYLVVGAGASGMSFVDALIANSDADVVMVDRRHRPGGHWVDDYPFIRLHQPSAYYGVNSRPLGTDRIDVSGPNAGFYERATAAEVCDYYARVLDEQLLPSGRVRFLGMTDYLGNGSDEHHLRSRLTGDSTTVRVRRKLVDATYLETSTPSGHTPSYRIDPEARVVTPNDLAGLNDPGSGFTVIGAGKTSMDTCCWLVDQGVDPDTIRWIRPRDAWTIDRALVQPLKLMGNSIVEWLARQVEVAAEAEDVGDMLRLSEVKGVFIRLDPNIEPTVYRGAILSEIERAMLRRISNVVRLGRVLAVGIDEIELQNGTIPTDRRHVHVDCTAEGLATPPGRPIFEPGRITVQRIQFGIDPFNPALIGFVEAVREDDVEKNRLCPANATTSDATEWPKRLLVNQRAQATWLSDSDVREWLATSRLTPLRDAVQYLAEPAAQAAFMRYVGKAGPAIENLERILARTTAVPA